MQSSSNIDLRTRQRRRRVRSSAVDHFVEDVLAFLPYPTFVVDPAGVVIGWNSAIEALTGVAASQVVGRGDREYALPFYGERRPLLVDFVIGTAEQPEQLYPSARRDGEMLEAETFVPALHGGSYLWARASPLHGARGELVGAIETVRDRPPRQWAQPQSGPHLGGDALIDEFFDGVALMVAGRVRWVNQALCDLMGYAREEMIGFTLEQISAPDELPKLQQRMRTRLAGEAAPARYFTRARRKDGVDIEIENSVKVISYLGQPALLVQVRDVSRLRETERALRDAEMTLRTAIESLPFDFWILDVNGRYSMLNTVARTNWGDLVGKLPSEVKVDQQTLVRWQDNNARALAGEQVAGEVTLVVGGERRDFFNIVCPIFDGDVVRGALGVNIDITDRKRTEVELRQARAQIEATLNALPDLMFEVDGDGLILDFRAPRPDLLYAPPGVFLNRRMADVIPPEPGRVVMRAIADAAADQAPATGTYWLDLPVGRRWFEVSVAPKSYPADERRFIALVRDVTATRQAEEQLRQLNEELEQRVAERTAQLEEANRELESFVYSVSHDLHTPLHHIDGFSQVLLEDYRDQLGADGRRYLERVRGGVDRMTTLIEDLLKLSRIGRSELVPEKVDLSELARSVLSELQQAEPARRVELTIAPQLIARGDARLLRVVLQNLLGNAFKFTGRREVAHIEFGVRAAVEPGAPPVFFVRDDGAGFDAKHAERLFVAFQRMHSAEDFAGTGIGLATVKRIIVLHRGRIWAESAPDAGATFHFTLGG